jgi:tetratricopeptide (TPR) repeat protein
MDKNIADSFFNKGEFQRAADAYTQILDKNPRLSDVYSDRGLCHYYLLRIEDAHADFDKAIALEERNSEAYMHKGRMLMETNEPAAAKVLFTKAIDIYGKSDWYLTNLLWACSVLRHHEEAIVHANQLLEGNQNDIYALDNLVFAYMETGRHQESIDIIKRTMCLREPNWSEYNNWGFNLQQMGQYKAAIPYYNKALVYDATAAYPYDNRGFCKYKLGFVSEGLADIDHSLTLEPSNSYAYFYKGIIAYEQQKYADATRFLDAALALGYIEKFGEGILEWVEKVKSEI